MTSLVRTRKILATFIFVCSTPILISACGDTATLPVTAGQGPNPELPEPASTLIPTVSIAAAKGWTNGQKPIVAAGLDVNLFASDLDHPRWLHVLPNGDILVAESNAQPKETKGIRDWIMKKVMKRAGAGVPSADRITLLRDTDADGVADLRTIFLKNLRSPIGMALVGNDFYVANTDAVMHYTYTEGETSIKSEGRVVAELPEGPINHHWTKNMIASDDGTTLYVSVGSNSNVGENGMDKEVNRAAILAIDIATGATRLFAGGLRNPVGMDWNPTTGELWTAVNERDELGSDLVPDYMTSVKDGGFYGWPYSYYGQTVDTRIQPPRPDLVATAIKPDYALGAHTASLGLTFNTSKTFPPNYTNGAFVGQHGSWNRKPRSGYKVIFVPFTDGKPSGLPQDVLSGFIDLKDDKALGRPVDVAINTAGDLLVTDDVGNMVWRISPSQ